MNIGKLGAAAAEYYIGEVASSAEDYYVGHGEAAGRWMGSVAHDFGLQGEVDAEHFRRLLNGQHPFSGGFLVSSRGSAARARARKSDDAKVDSVVGERVDTLRAAAHLGVSGQYVRRLLAEGASYRARLASATEGVAVAEPSAYLFGEHVPRDGRHGGDEWMITRVELEQFAKRRGVVKARPGYDLTLRPPKSVSVLWALAEPDERAVIRCAHREAVDEVVRYYESRAVFVRRGGGARDLVAAAGIVAAAFDHRTSRAGDPLLHTHVVTANMTYAVSSTGDVEWRTIAGAGLFEHAKAAGHLYQAHLRHLLTVRLGIEFAPVVNGHADVVGVPEPIVGLFSKRRAEIVELLSEAGHSSARAAQVATLQTRKSKDYGVDSDTVESRWKAEAVAAGFGPEQVAACFGRAQAAELTEEQIAQLMEALGGSHGLTERSATFTRTTVIEAIASASGSAATAGRVEAIADGFLASQHVLLVDRSPLVENHDVGKPLRDPHQISQRSKVRRSSTQKLYTTPELCRLEGQLLTWAADTSRSGLLVSAEVAQAVIEARPELSVEQQVMVKSLCSSSEFIQPVSGRPGAGKTYATEAVVAAHVAARVPIIGCAVSAAAADELERAAGFARSTGASASTVASLLLELDGPYGGLRPGTVIIVDEASTIGTRDLARLTAAAHAADGAVKLIGDPDQHGAVDVGGVFRRLCADRGNSLVMLVENNRQRDHTERLAVTEYREGRIGDALARYDQAGKVVRSRTAGESFDAIVADWYAARIHGGTDPMIAGPNSTRRALNERARVLLKTNGELTGTALTIGSREFQVGDDVVARRNDRTLRVVGSREFVKNGSVGTIASVGGDTIVVAFEREGRIRVPHRYLAAGHLEHGYARTTYGVQGATHEIARYHPTDVSSFEEGYVAITRSRTAARIYIVDGNLPGGSDDLTHTPDEAKPFGLREIAESLAHRRGGHMAADAADRLGAVAATLNGKTLAQLTTRRRQLGRILAKAPPGTSRDIDEIGRFIDSLRARRNAWTMVFKEAHARSNQPCPDEPNVMSRAAGAIGRLDRSIASQQGKLDSAIQQQAKRREWFDQHADLVGEHDLVRRAERARETQIRIVATQQPPPGLLRLIGPEPAVQTHRLLWRSAIEAAAVYRERHGVPDIGDGGVDGLPGERPRDPLTAAEYLEVVAATAQARDAYVSAELSAGVEL